MILPGVATSPSVSCIHVEICARHCAILWSWLAEPNDEVIKMPPPFSCRLRVFYCRKLTFLGAGEEAYLMGEDGVPLQEVSIHEQHHKDYRYDLGYEHVDPDDLKRHHAIIERMQFRGPVWDKYKREGTFRHARSIGDCFRHMRQTERILDYVL